MDYTEFIASKRIADVPTGLTGTPDLNPGLFPFQRDIVRWALARGRAAIFADCGMGKTLMQLEWAHHVPGRSIIVAPLAVAAQTVREAAKFGIPGVAYHRQPDPSTRITVTNYEMLEKFDPGDFEAVVLDESSILKSYTGKFRNYIIDHWGRVPFRLAATATPAPNDFMELGNHSEFIGAMSRTDMLATFFVHDGGETQKWRLKGHAQDKFWEWVTGWAVMIQKPSDLGYEDGGFSLPPLEIIEDTVEPPASDSPFLFDLEARTLQERRDARRSTVRHRVAKVAELVNASRDPWVVWCDLNDESTALSAAIPDSVEVRGSDSPEDKETRLAGFADGTFRVIITKPSIAGWGLNWQHCAHMAFTGLSDSYEQFYQAVRRCWRFGQERPVFCHVVTATTEGAVVANIRRKEAASEEMAASMVAHMRGGSIKDIRSDVRQGKSYSPTITITTPAFL